ncbi:UPF0606 protein KIAA1549 homolog [Tachyglossus aculeatus]|uniref:UPF0606 protein KIAA1549 homolog n=1 Tax=Tachyglossus aculeatus TaxID=9261 RepID=UPI0018F45DAA|nr:UPF0606 protein KIAA1549 homolog [Tachyglossus aculeatus]
MPGPAWLRPGKKILQSIRVTAFVPGPERAAGGGMERAARPGGSRPGEEGGPGDGAARPPGPPPLLRDRALVLVLVLALALPGPGASDELLLDPSEGWLPDGTSEPTVEAKLTPGAPGSSFLHGVFAPAVTPLGPPADGSGGEASGGEDGSDRPSPARSDVPAWPPLETWRVAGLAPSLPVTPLPEDEMRSVLPGPREAEYLTTLSIGAGGRLTPVSGVGSKLYSPDALAISPSPLPPYGFQLYTDALAVSPSLLLSEGMPPASPHGGSEEWSSPSAAGGDDDGKRRSASSGPPGSSAQLAAGTLIPTTPSGDETGGFSLVPGITPTLDSTQRPATLLSASLSVQSAGISASPSAPGWPAIPGLSPGSSVGTAEPPTSPVAAPSRPEWPGPLPASGPPTLCGHCGPSAGPGGHDAGSGDDLATPLTLAPAAGGPGTVAPTRTAAPASPEYLEEEWEPAGDAFDSSFPSRPGIWFSSRPVKELWSSAVPPTASRAGPAGDLSTRISASFIRPEAGTLADSASQGVLASEAETSGLPIFVPSPLPWDAPGSHQALGVSSWADEKVPPGATGAGNPSASPSLAPLAEIPPFSLQGAASVSKAGLGRSLDFTPGPPWTPFPEPVGTASPTHAGPARGSPVLSAPARLPSAGSPVLPWTARSSNLFRSDSLSILSDTLPPPSPTGSASGSLAIPEMASTSLPDSGDSLASAWNAAPSATESSLAFFGSWGPPSEGPHPQPVPTRSLSDGDPQTASGPSSSSAAPVWTEGPASSSSPPRPSGGGPRPTSSGPSFSGILPSRELGVSSGPWPPSPSQPISEMTPSSSPSGFVAFSNGPALGHLSAGPSAVSAASVTPVLTTTAGIGPGDLGPTLGTPSTLPLPSSGASRTPSLLPTVTPSTPSLPSPGATSIPPFPSQGIPSTSPLPFLGTPSTLPLQSQGVPNNSPLPLPGSPSIPPFPTPVASSSSPLLFPESPSTPLLPSPGFPSTSPLPFPGTPTIPPFPSRGASSSLLLLFPESPSTPVLPSPGFPSTSPLPFPGNPGTPPFPSPGAPSSALLPFPESPSTPFLPSPGFPSTSPVPFPGNPGTPSFPSPGSPSSSPLPFPGAPSMPGAVIATPTPVTTRQPYVCDITVPDAYLITAVLARRAVQEYIIMAIKEVLRLQFSRAVELEVYEFFPEFSFLVTSGPFVYTAIAVINVLINSSLVRHRTPLILSVQPTFSVPGARYQVQTVLQFVPRGVDPRFCNFTQRVERGLRTAFAEVRKQQRETHNFTVQILNVTVGTPWTGPRQGPVSVVFAVRGRDGFLNGSEVSELLRNLSRVEFSFYLGFPVQQIAEPFQYPQLNVSHLMKSSWVKTVLLGVIERRLQSDVFRAEMERKLARVLSEALAGRRLWRRASFAGSRVVQVVNVSRLEGDDSPVQLVYFVEDQDGQRLGAAAASELINRVDLQRAAIILGYRIRGSLAQPLDRARGLPPESRSNNLWIAVGVAGPAVVVVAVLVILYWKLCRTDKLDFQTDPSGTVQPRQKLQVPSVKGFDFAKQHLGQHSKDDILTLQEPDAPPPPPPPGPGKEPAPPPPPPSENGEVAGPAGNPAAKAPPPARRRGRVSPSDADSSESEPSSEREATDEPAGLPAPAGRASREPQGGPLAPGGGNELPSSASLFEHVDRMPRAPEPARRLPGKIQLIAMQPIPAPPLADMALSDRIAETNKMNKEIQTALRHKSEIEHHRNKIRLRAKRRGHYEFPVADDLASGDSRERHRVYRKAQMQIDKILDPGASVPSVFIEPRKSSRAKRSPKLRRRHPATSSSPADAERDRLLTTDSDGTCKRPPGVHNSAYVSDPDLPAEPRTPSSEEPGGDADQPTGPPYVPPRPSIEEARQTMHCLLDDAFALVAPGGPCATPPVARAPPASHGTPGAEGRRAGPWGPVSVAHNPGHRYDSYCLTPQPAPAPAQRPGFGPGFLPPPEPQQPVAGAPFATRGVPVEQLPSVARPRPIGGATGPQGQQLVPLDLPGRIAAQPVDVPTGRAGPGQCGGPGWPSLGGQEQGVRRGEASYLLGVQEYPSSSLFPGPRTVAREPSAPSAHQGPGFSPGAAADPPPAHSSASLIKAIREELLRLAQKQSVGAPFHS